jgi:putative ABC transport system permease protein
VLTPPLAPVGGIFGRIPAEGQSADEVARNPALTYELATPHYFPTLGISLERGRLFTDADREGTLPVAILSASAARSYWPHGDAIGKRLVTGKAERLTVVGVVRDTHYRDLRNPRPSIYLPLRQSTFPFAPTTLVIASEGRPGALVPILRGAVAQVGPGVAVASAVPFETFVADTLAQPELNALLLALFAGAALTLAAVGLFGVMATAVRQRTREIAIRVALGATPAGIRRGVLREALFLLGAGGCLGLGLALAMTRWLRSLLFGVSPSDPLTLVLGAGVLAGVALLAAYLPARRASRIDPAQALRAEA